MIKHTILVLATVFILVGNAVAERAPRVAYSDSRIRTVTFSQNDVVVIDGHYGFTTSIEFADYETVQTVSIGDSEAWQVVKPSQPNLLFVKPIQTQADTNMTVVTDQRIYTFMLRSHQAKTERDRKLIFHVSFRYPDDAQKQIAFESAEAKRLAATNLSDTITPDQWNFSYTFAGSSDLRPTRTFDDGRFTYFAWPETTPLPAIFIVNADGTEQLVNHVAKGDYIVVERLGHQFTLREGETTTCIFNNAFPIPDFDEGAPNEVEIEAPDDETVVEELFG